MKTAISLPGDHRLEASDEVRQEPGKVVYSVWRGDRKVVDQEVVESWDVLKARTERTIAHLLLSITKRLV